MSASVQEVFARAAASSTEGESTQAAILRQALEASQFMDITEEALGLHMVTLRPSGLLLLAAVEDALEDSKGSTLIAREGEVPLSWLMTNPHVARCLARAGIHGGQAALEALRDAVDASERYVLDGPRVSARLRGREEWPELSSNAAARGRGPGERPCAGSLDPSGEVRRGLKRGLPAENDARRLRKLLGFYFDLFNLQHNQVLMGIVEAQRRQPAGSAGRAGYLRSKGQRPVFRLKDLFVLPRIEKVFQQYSPELAPLLLALATTTEEPFPVRASARRTPGTPRGAWAAVDPRLELTYLPDLRFLEVQRICPEVQPLLQAASDPADTVRVLPPHALCIASYSVSSDLSHSQSPKAVEVNERVADGSIDPGLLTWDCRQLKIRRQLLMFDPDVICVQGVQSIGFAERCSEWDASWFNFEEEPSSNHLVHLYRQVSKANYGVAFAPTMKLPGSAVVCFGNAVFWKRSRWQVERQRGIRNSAVCVELASRLIDWRIAVCSAKSAAVYAKDWGDQVADDELAQALEGVQQALAEAAAAGLHPVWCGDFGGESGELLPALRSQAAEGASPPAWRSPFATMLGEEPWTSVSRQTAHRSVDLILHDENLRAVAVLGGLQNQVSLVDLLSTGYPSDHLMQLAVLVDAKRASRCFHGAADDNGNAGPVDDDFPPLPEARGAPPPRRQWRRRARPASPEEVAEEGQADLEECIPASPEELIQ